MTALIHPESEANAVALAELVERLTSRIQARESIDLDAIVRDHPEHAEELRRLMPALAMLADISRSPGSVASVGGCDSTFGELGDFRIIREVGRGGMGVVYEAQQVSLGRRVALKVLPFAATMDPKQLQRFRNEAMAAANLRHEHIVHVYGVGCERAVHFYAMEFIDGQTLAQIISYLYRPSGQPKPPTADKAAAPTAPVAALSTEPGGTKGREFYRSVARLIADAADALEHAHQLGVVHRDVKPGNLMVDATGKLWVTDFGLARFGADAGLTMTGDLLGTLRYMAPEQALAKHGLVDHRVDVYGLGATLYELLTGWPAISGEDKQEILRRIAFEEPVAPRRLDKAIPAELETVTHKALAKEPADRYATAGELSADLRRFVADQPIQAQRPTLGRRTSKWVGRHRTAVPLTALAVILAALALVAATFWHNRELQAAATREAEQSQRAMRQRNEARQAVEDMYTQVAEKWLDGQPRLQPLQREFLQKALGYYQDFAQDDAGDPEARLAAGRAYLRVGTIQVKLGAYSEGEQAFRRCVAIMEELAARQPVDATCRSLRGSAWQGLGAVLTVVGRHSEAGEASRQAITTFRLPKGEVPAAADDQSRLGDAYDTLGQSLENAGSLASAEAAYRHAMLIREQLAAQAPAEPIYQVHLAGTLQHLGRLHYLGQHFEPSGTAFERAVAIAEGLVKDYPREPEYQKQLARYQFSASVLWWKTGHPSKAELLLRRNVEVQSRLAADFPDLPAYREELALSWNMLGNVCSDMSRSADAVAAYRRAIEIKDRLVADFPAVPAYRQDLVQALNNLTGVLTQMRHDAEAGETNTRGRRYAEQLVADFPAVAIYRKDLARVHQRRAGLRLAAGDFGQAAAAWRDALAASDHPDIRDGAAEFLANCTDQRYSDPAGAVRLAEANVRDAPENSGYWETLGLALHRAGRIREAVTALERAREQQLARESVSVTVLTVLAMARWQAGDKDRAQRDFAVAKELFGKTTGSDESVGRLLAEAAALLGQADGSKAAAPPPW